MDIATPTHNKIGRLISNLLPMVLAVSFLSLTLLLLTVVAQTTFPEAEVEFFIEERTSQNPLTVGDQLVMRLEVYHPTDSRVSLPQVDRDWGNFRVVQQTSPEEVNNGDGTSTTSKEIVVTVFEPGFYKTLPLVVTHRRPDGEIEELAAPVIQLRVTSIISDPEDIELRDLKEQAALPVAAVWPWVVGGLILVAIIVAAISWAIWWFYLRRRKPDVEEAEIEVRPVTDARPPEVIAYAELARIEQLKLPEQNKIKEHYTLVANCLRQYIENRYQITALEQTTSEINQGLRRQQLPLQQMSNFMNVLTESDLVKFARYQPAQESIASIISRARMVIASTTPKSSREPTVETPTLEKQP